MLPDRQVYAESADPAISGQGQTRSVERRTASMVAQPIPLFLARNRPRSIDISSHRYTDCKTGMLLPRTALFPSIEQSKYQLQDTTLSASYSDLMMML